jgi:TolB-like protein
VARPLLRCLLLAATCAWLEVCGASSAAAEEPVGIAVAPMTALEVAETTAAILTGIAEGVAAEHAHAGRFVAHGELLRTVDAGPEIGCRDSSCLATATQALGAAYLLTGEVGRIGEARVVTVQLTRVDDEATVSAASRQCDACDEGALPALLDEALYEVLSALDRSDSPISDDGRTITLSLRRRASAAHYQDRHRTLANTALQLDGIQLSSLTRPGEQLGCLERGEPAVMITGLQVINTTDREVTVDGELGIEVIDELGGDPLVTSRFPVHRVIGAAEEADPRIADDGSWIPPTNVWKESVELQLPTASAAPMRVRVRWNEEQLEELITRPVARVARVDDLYLERAGERVQTLDWGQPMAVHLVLTKHETTAAAEVTLNMRRKLRYWFDTDDTHAYHAIAASADGAYHLVLPFTPALSQQDSTESLAFEVWINGCLQHRSSDFR